MIEKALYFFDPVCQMRERGLNGMQLSVYSKGGQGDRRYPQLRLLCTKEEATGKGNEGNTKSRGEGKHSI